MSLPDLDRVSAITFDCYGTLVDWESGILAAMIPLARSHGVEASSEAVLAAYARAEAAAEQGKYVRYREVLRRTFTGMAKDLGFAPQPGEVDTLSDSLPEWDPFPDTPSSLRVLANHYRLGVISNVDEDLFAGTHARLGVRFDLVVTAESVGAYKPSPEMFEHALARAGLAPDQVLHAAQSAYHDIAPARALGIPTVHVVRASGRDGAGAVPAATAEADWTVPDLRGLVALLGLE